MNKDVIPFPEHLARPPAEDVSPDVEPATVVDMTEERIAKLEQRIAKLEQRTAELEKENARLLDRLRKYEPVDEMPEMGNVASLGDDPLGEG